MIHYLTKLLFKPKIPVICLRETITEGVYHTISRQLNLISNIKAIAIVIDSQKGEPVQTQLLANKIKRLGKKYQVPIYSFVETKCTGQPYLFVGIANRSYCLESSIIGAFRNVNWFGVEGMLEDNKIQQRSWVSNQNSILRMMLPFRDVDKSILKTRIGEIQNQIAEMAFKESKHQSKGENRQISIDNYKATEYSIGKQAIDKGLISEIGNLYTVLQKQFPETQLKFIQHSTILKQYLGVALALPFVGIVLLLGFKSFLKYFTLFIIYLFYKNKSNKKDKQSKTEP